MKNSLRHIKSKLSSDRLFLQHFLQIFLTMTVIFSAFTVFTYHNSRRIIENEFTNSGLQDLRNLSEYVEDLIVETKDMIATLVNNEMLQMFYASPTPEAIWDDYAKQVQNQLMALCYSRESIENIYLYSEASNTIYSSSQHQYADSFEDRFWLEQLDSDKYGFTVFPYAMKNRFPYVICVAKEFDVNHYHCAIAIMVDLSKIPILASINENDYQRAYLVSDDSEIIYRYRQEMFKAPLDTVEYLCNYDASATEKVCLASEGSGTYSYAQLHSADYPWSYVLVTHLENYTARLSTQNALVSAIFSALIIFAVLYAIFFALRSLKPIENIRRFLDSPELLSAGDNSDSADIKYIAGRITQYIQTNQQLKEELNDRLNLLNETQMTALQSQINPHFLFNTLNMMYVQATDSLGYEHSLPLMILDTSSLIRYAMNPEKMVTLETELSYTDIYLSILNLRYDNALQIIRNINQDALSAKVPRLFIQPIIENSVFHGFSNRRNEECILSIQCYRQATDNEASGEFVVVEIKDNGKGISENKLCELQESLKADAITSSKNIGLRNVIQRMNLIYTDQFTLGIESVTEKGTCFSLRFPYIE